MSHIEVMGNITVFTLYPLYKSHFLKPTPHTFFIYYFQITTFAIHNYIFIIT